MSYFLHPSKTSYQTKLPISKKLKSEPCDAQFPKLVGITLEILKRFLQYFESVSENFGTL